MNIQFKHVDDNNYCLIVEVNGLHYNIGRIHIEHCGARRIAGGRSFMICDGTAKFQIQCTDKELMIKRIEEVIERYPDFLYNYFIKGQR